MPDDSALRYREGGAGSGLSLLQNEAQWQRYAIVPRVLSGVSSPDLSSQLFGLQSSFPLLVAPSALHQLWHPDGERETARGVRAAGTVFALSQSSSYSPESVSKISGPYLQQLYLTQDRDFLLPFIRSCQEWGATGFLFTVDQLAVPYQQPFRHGAADLFAQYSHWSPGEPDQAERWRAAPAASLSLADLEWLLSHTTVPVVAKGILSAEDARRVVDAGAAGIVVSNHGGRQIGGSVTPAEVLPAVIDEVGTDVPVLVDSGIRTADDIFVALCLGAQGAFVGRPVLRALASGGAEAVRQYLVQLQSELLSLCILAGVGSVQDFSRDKVLLRDPALPPGNNQTTDSVLLTRSTRRGR